MSPLSRNDHNLKRTSRKRRPSYSQDDREYYSINDDDPMDECNAALVLMSLSCSPNSSVHGYETILGTSSGSSTTSWSTGSTSPPLSEDGHSTPPTHHYQHELNHHHHHHHNGRYQAASGTGRGARTTSLSTSDEGIGMEDMPRKRRRDQLSVAVYGRVAMVCRLHKQPASHIATVAGKLEYCRPCVWPMLWHIRSGELECKLSGVFVLVVAAVVVMSGHNTAERACPWLVFTAQAQPIPYN
uniref:Uncharacterized protein n=1 Tax=Anopheles stephensi TaxID=30069 RepID=A0A182Y4K9_ANOST